MRLRNSTTFRITLAHLTFFCSSVLILFAAVYLASTNNMRIQVDKTIQQAITTLSENYESKGLIGLERLISRRVRRMQPIPDALYLLTDPALVPIAGNLLRWPGQTPDEDGWINFKISHDDGVLNARAQTFQLTGGYYLLVGRSTDLLDQSAEVILKIMILGMITTMLLGGLAGAMMTKKVNRRLETIHNTAKTIQQGQIGERIPVSDNNDEFDRLILQLNNMLDQIERLMESVRTVSDNIAHDLRTPLSRLQQGLDQLNQSTDLSENHRALVHQSLEDSRHLLDTFNALLRIARIEANAQRSAFQSVDLSALTNDIAELYEPLAVSVKQKLSILRIDHCFTEGNKDLLFQCLANLTDNAIKYSKGTIDLSLIKGDLDHMFIIRDNGPGIPNDEQKRVFERFYRLDQSRCQPGSGLGLSLVDAILKLHHARIELINTQPGLEVRVLFKAKKAIGSSGNEPDHLPTQIKVGVQNHTRS